MTPAWLAADAPSGDVVLSTRARVMRNLRGHPFPSRLSGLEAVAVLAQIEGATHLKRLESLTAAEMGLFVSARLVPSEFRWTEPGRAVLLDPAAEQSLLINEEDHLRLQVVSAGMALGRAREMMASELARLSERLEFARDPAGGFLASSVYNRGPGRRDSAMVHLVGLVATGKIGAVMTALSAQGVVVRGLFGESSRALGGYLQISSISGDPREMDGALRYVEAAEQAARSGAGTGHLRGGVEASRQMILTRSSFSLGDAVRVIGWLRWGIVAGVLPESAPRSADVCLAQLDPADRREAAGLERAKLLQSLI